jgi:hypothetical protein
LKLAPHCKVGNIENVKEKRMFLFTCSQSVSTLCVFSQ